MTELILPKSSSATRLDDINALQNIATGMGVSGRDPQTHLRRKTNDPILDRYTQSFLTRQFKLLDKVVRIIPQQMVFRWGHMTIASGDAKTKEADTDLQDAVHKWMDKMPVRSLVNRWRGVDTGFCQAQIAANRSGNAGLILMAADGRAPDEPLNLKSLKDIKGLYLADRWSLRPDISGIYASMTGEYGIDHYVLSNQRANPLIDATGKAMPGSQVKVHRSRVLWFRGNELSDNDLLQNQGCDDSVLESTYRSFLEYYQGIRGAGRMVTDYDVSVHKIEGLLVDLFNDETGVYREKLMQRLQVNSLSRSMWRGMIIDKEQEELENVNRNAGGYDALLDRLLDDFQANTDLQPAELLGKYAKGLAATDATQVQYANDRTAAFQSSKFDPNLHDLFEAMFNCSDGPTKGKEPKTWDWEWVKLYPTTPLEESELELNRAQIDQINIGAGVYTAKDAGNSHYSGPNYEPNITVDFKERDRLLKEAEAQQQAQLEAQNAPQEDPYAEVPTSGNEFPTFDSVTDLPIPAPIKQAAAQGLKLKKKLGRGSAIAVLFARKLAYQLTIDVSSLQRIQMEMNRMRRRTGWDNPDEPSDELVSYYLRGGSGMEIWLKQLKLPAFGSEQIADPKRGDAEHTDFNAGHALAIGIGAATVAGAAGLAAHALSKKKGKPCGEGYISSGYECHIGAGELKQLEISKNNVGHVFTDPQSGERLWRKTPQTATTYASRAAGNIPDGLNNSSPGLRNFAARLTLDINRAVALPSGDGAIFSPEERALWEASILPHTLPDGGVVLLEGFNKKDIETAERLGLQKVPKDLSDKARGVYFGKYENGAIRPISSQEILDIEQIRDNRGIAVDNLESMYSLRENLRDEFYRKQIKRSRPLTMLEMISQAPAGTPLPPLSAAKSKSYFNKEDSALQKVYDREDKVLGRSPSAGIAPLSVYKKRSEDWAKEQFGEVLQGANGFSLAQTKAHDIAHPLVHEMLGMDSDGIRTKMGGKGKTLNYEEAIVNVAEHLSRGDTIEASVMNGARLARVLSRNPASTDEERSHVRSSEFLTSLSSMAWDIYRHDDFRHYMEHIKTTNRKSGTVLVSGENFNNSASGG